MRTLLAAAAALALAACAAPARSPLNTPLPSPQDQKILATTIECDEPQECDFMWRKAQAWVASNADMKVQSANATIIETFNPTPRTGRMGVRVVRLPLTPTRSRINFEPLCGGDAFCNAHSVDRTIGFKRELIGDK